jgi:transglutaminase-like putative cysteine protease
VSRISSAISAPGFASYSWREERPVTCPGKPAALSPRRARRATRWLCALAALSASAPSSGATGGDAPFRISEPPHWIAPVDVELPPATPATAPRADGVDTPDAANQAAAPEGGSGSATWLLEAQIYVPRTGEPVRFFRSVVELRDRSALDDFSTIEIVHAPPHERVELHRLRVRRDGLWSDRLQVTEHRVAQRETALAQNVLSGHRSLLLLVPDLRVGDVLESSWSVVGENTALAGHVSSEWRLAPPGAKRRRFDLWVEPGAFVEAKVLGDGPEGIDVIEPNGLRHRSWDLAPPEAAAEEAFVPGDVLTEPRLQLSGYRTWQEVVEWGRRLYPRTASSAALDRVAAAWRGLPPEERVLEALRFVQGEIRYLALAEGEHTLRPRPPEQVLERRFGDCKEKSALLIELLARLDVAAHSVLVSSWRGAALPDALPSPGVFDHAIVGAELDGRHLFLDPTLEPQSATSLDALWLPRYRYGLRLAPGSSALTEIPDELSAIPEREVVARYEVAPGLRSWKVEIETRHRGQGADRFRADVARDGREALATSYLDFYRSSVPELASESLVIRDGPDRSDVVTLERYRHETPEPGFETLPLELSSSLPLLDKPGERRFPVALRYPFAHRETLEIHSPGTRFEPISGRIDNRWFLFEAGTKSISDGVQTTYRLETRSDRVAPADAPEFAEEVEKMNELLGISIQIEAPEPPRLAAALSLALGAAVFFFAGRAARRRLRELATGAAPA